jgi:peptidyl-tRNA hydrolase, PTH1 family
VADSILFIVGLGNPGKDYEDTRHNAGALFVEALARSAGASLKPERKFHGLHSKILLHRHEIHLLNPTTFMNRSGQAVAALAQFYKIAPEQILVAHDELDIPLGTARIKKGGGHGGHNGLRDIIAHLQTKEFYRLRLGIDHPGDKSQVVNYVLGRFGISERQIFDQLADESIRVMPWLVEGEHAKAMNQLHTYKA